jgi:hypothetical protein
MGRGCSTYGGISGVFKVLMGKADVKRPLGDLGVYGRIILSWNFREWM